MSLVSARSFYNNRWSSTVIIVVPGRSSDFPLLLSAFPFRYNETVAHLDKRIPQMGKDHSGGPVFDFHEVP